MNKRRRLEGLARNLIRHFRCGQAAQLIVHLREQFLRDPGVAFALLHAVENASNVAHVVSRRF